MHSRELKQTRMSREGVFLAVPRVDIRLPVAAVCVERGEDGCLTQLVNKLVNVWQRIRFLDNYCVQLSVVDTKVERAIFLWDENYGAPSFCRCRLDEVFSEHIVHLRP